MVVLHGVDMHMQDSIFFKSKGFQVIKRTERDKKEWYYVWRKNGVAILAVTDREEIILVQQRRPIINKDLLEIPAGGADTRSLIKEARRELQEETGYYPKTIKKAVELFSSPGYYTEKTHIFFASDLVKKSQTLTKVERINNLQVVKKSLMDALDLIKTGKITDAKTVSAILLYAHFKKQKAV